MSRPRVAAVMCCFLSRSWREITHSGGERERERERGKNSTGGSKLRVFVCLFFFLKIFTKDKSQERVRKSATRWKKSREAIRATRPQQATKSEA